MKVDERADTDSMIAHLREELRRREAERALQAPPPEPKGLGARLRRLMDRVRGEPTTTR